MKKNFLFTFLLSAFFMFVFTSTASAQLGVSDAEKTSLTTACELCTLKSANKPLSDAQKASVAKLDATKLKWCPGACELLTKVNAPNPTTSLTTKQIAMIRKIHAALNPTENNNRNNATYDQKSNNN